MNNLPKELTVKVRYIKGYARYAMSLRAEKLSPLRQGMSPDYASPLAVILAVFCFVQIPFLALLPSVGALLTALFLFACFVLIFILSRKISKNKFKVVLRFTAFLFLALSLGVFTATLAGYSIRMPSERILTRFCDKEDVVVTARIDEAVSRGESYGIYDATLISLDGINAKVNFGRYPKIRISCFGQDSQSKGNIVSFKGTLSRPEKVTKDGFSQRRYLESQCIFISCDATDIMTVLAKQKPSTIVQLRNSLSAGLKRYTRSFSDDVSGIARCMLLGERSAVSDYVEDVFRASGASHVLSVSGMHLSMLFLVISKALRLGKRKRRRFPLSELISCLIALCYMAITAFTPSIMRAGFMLILANIFSAIIYYMKKFGFSPKNFTKIFSMTQTHKAPNHPIMSTLTCLLASAAIISILSPFSLFDIGMQLSFMSTLGIIISLPVMSRITGYFGISPIALVLSSVTVTLFAIGFTFPISVYSFGTTSLFSPFTNLFLLPLATPLLLLLLILALASLLPPLLPIVKICEALGVSCGILCRAAIRVCEYFASSPYSVLISENSISVTILFAILASAAFIFSAFSKKKLASIFGVGTVVLYLLCTVFYFSNTYVSRCIPTLTLCTVSERPYACVAIKNSKVIFDSGTSLAKTNHALDVKGDTLYYTDNIYAVALSSDFAPEYVIENIEAYKGQIKTVLLPSPEKAEASGVNISVYRNFLQKLNDKNYGISFYNEEFSVSDLTFKVTVKKDKTSFTYSDVSLVFAKEYDEYFASNISYKSRYCIYFCDKAKTTDNLGYTSNAKLYVSSARSKKINGAEKIPTSKPVLFLPQIPQEQSD